MSELSNHEQEAVHIFEAMAKLAFVLEAEAEPTPQQLADKHGGERLADKLVEHAADAIVRCRAPRMSEFLFSEDLREAPVPASRRWWAEAVDLIRDRYFELLEREWASRKP
jgi:hypothetical protein